MGLALAAGLILGPVGSAQAEFGDGEVTDRLDEKAAAFRNWLPRALRGDSLAQFELGAAFSTGRSAPEDFAEAARWFKKAAQQGNPRAQNGLAILYSKGLGVRRDFTEAYIWWHLAAERFEHGLRREQAIELRDMVAAFMTPEQLVTAKRLAEARKAGWE
jgi:TPR repeat protein